MGAFMSTIWPRGILFWILTGVLGYSSLAVLAVSISSFLYQLAELAEEYPTLAGIILRKYALPIVCALHVLLWMDGLPFMAVLIGLLCHGSYYLMLKSYPLINVYSATSVVSAVSFFVCHWNWLNYFSDLGTQQRENYDGTAAPGMGRISMLHLVGFFMVCVWLIPVGIFISMTVNDNVLPGTIEVMDSGEKKKGGSNPFKTLYDKLQLLVEVAADKLYTGALTKKKYHNQSFHDEARSSNSNFLSQGRDGTNSFMNATANTFQSNISHVPVLNQRKAE